MSVVWWVCAAVGCALCAILWRVGVECANLAAVWRGRTPRVTTEPRAAAQTSYIRLAPRA